jgi:hypothetical protein
MTKRVLRKVQDDFTDGCWNRKAIPTHTEIRAMNFYQSQFVTLEEIKPKGMTLHYSESAPVTPTSQENTEMNAEHHNESTALTNTMRIALHDKNSDLDKEYHIHGHRAKTVREYISMVKDDQYEDIEDKVLDHKLDSWADPTSWIHLRKHKADPAGRAGMYDKIAKEYDDILLKIKVLPPAEVLPRVEHFRDVTCRKHTVH